MKWVIALLFMTVTTWIGLEWSHKFNQRPMHIRQLKNALQILEAEMLYSQLPLQDAFREIAKQMPAPTNLFFSFLSTEMEKQTGDFNRLWELAVQRLMQQAALAYNDQEILLQFGRTIGQHNFEQQQKHIQLALSHLDRELEEATHQQHKYGKIAKSLGFLSGLFIVIVFI